MKTTIYLIALLLFAVTADADTVTRTTCSTHTYANGETKLECTTRTSNRPSNYITLAPLPNPQLARPFYFNRRSR
jgi:succinate dehydrogenase/fumarate reductase-like Fe-S protein